MSVTIHLPQHVEQAFSAAAEAKGVSIDVLVRDLLLTHLPAPQSAQEALPSCAEWVEEEGISVLRTGHPITPEVVDDTLNLIRRERELAVLGQF